MGNELHWEAVKQLLVVISSKLAVIALLAAYLGLLGWLSFNSTVKYDNFKMKRQISPGVCTVIWKKKKKTFHKMLVILCI